MAYDTSAPRARMAVVRREPRGAGLILRRAEFSVAEGDILDIGVNWAPWLDTDEIVDSEWELDSGLYKLGQVETDQTTTLWFQADLGGKHLTIRNTITTEAGRKVSVDLEVEITDAVSVGTAPATWETARGTWDS